MQIKIALKATKCEGDKKIKYRRKNKETRYYV